MTRERRLRTHMKGLAKGAGGGSLVAPRTGRWAQLATIDGHIDFIYALLVSEPSAFRWLYRAGHPSRAGLESNLREDGHVNFVVQERRLGTPVGFVVMHGRHATPATGIVSAVFLPSVRQTGLAIEGIALFILYLFTVYAYHKVYFEVFGSDISSVRTALESGLVQEEGRLRNHCYRNGLWEDKVVLALYRSTFESWFLELENVQY